MTQTTSVAEIAEYIALRTLDLEALIGNGKSSEDSVYGGILELGLLAEYLEISDETLSAERKAALTPTPERQTDGD